MLFLAVEHQGCLKAHGDIKWAYLGDQCLAFRGSSENFILSISFFTIWHLQYTLKLKLLLSDQYPTSNQTAT